MTALDHRDEDLLNALREEFPISSTPYAIIGQTTDMSEKEVIKRITRMSAAGVIPAIQATFDPRAVGCQIDLVVARVTEEKLDEAVQLINSHPGVSQNYLRNHDYNLWFTLCLPHDSSASLDQTVEFFAQRPEIDSIIRLEALSTWKEGAAITQSESDGWMPNDGQRRMIAVLEGGIPLQPRPFDSLARQASVGSTELIEFAAKMRDENRVRRLGPVIRQPGSPRFSTYAMGLWQVEPSEVEEVARIFSNHPRVTGATVRRTGTDWPWNVFTIIQGRSVDECESAMAELANRSAVEQSLTLFPLREFKRSRITLFPEGLDQWEHKYLGVSRIAAS